MIKDKEGRTAVVPLDEYNELVKLKDLINNDNTVGCYTNNYNGFKYFFNADEEMKSLIEDASNTNLLRDRLNTCSMELTKIKNRSLWERILNI